MQHCALMQVISAMSTCMAQLQIYQSVKQHYSQKAFSVIYTRQICTLNSEKKKLKLLAGK